MSLSKTPSNEGPKKPTPEEMSRITRFMSSKIGKPKPKQVDKTAVKQAFEKAKEKGVVPKAPEVIAPITIAPVKNIEIAKTAESEALIKGDKEAINTALEGYTANKVQQGFIEADAFDNTIKRMATFDGIKPPTPGSSAYNQYKDIVNFNKDNLTISADEGGNPIFAQKMGWVDSYKSGYDGYNKSISSGKYYQENDDNK